MKIDLLQTQNRNTKEVFWQKWTGCQSVSDEKVNRTENLIRILILIFRMQSTRDKICRRKNEAK